MIRVRSIKGKSGWNWELVVMLLQPGHSESSRSNTQLSVKHGNRTKGSVFHCTYYWKGVNAGLKQ